MINKFIRNFIAKQIAGRSDDGIMITLKDPQRVTLGENILADLLMRNGIDPTAITSEQQLKNILQQIKNVEAAAIRNTDVSGIRGTKSAKVFNIEGEELDPNKPIIGGTQPPPGSRGGPDDIAAPVQSSEESLRDMMIAENKKAVDNLKQKMAKEKSRTQRISGNLRADNSQRVEIGRPKLDEDEYNYYREILGEDAEVDYYPVKGDETKEFLEAMVKEQKDEMDYMKRLYDKGALDDPEKKATGGRVGFFMGSQFPKGLATLREMLKFFSKGKGPRGKERPGSEILRLVNPKAFNKLLEDPNIYKKFDIKRGIAAPDLIKNMQADLAKSRKMMVEEILSGAKNIRQSDIGTMERKKEIVAEMMRKGVDRETAESMADTLATMAESAAGKLDTPKLTDEGILELENILKNMETGGKKKRDLNADGGRIGFKDGMTRRTFLKLLGGLASIPIIGKIVKPLKTVKGVKNVPIIKTDNVAGKPEWFDQLVNKVIIEGDDVTKKFATAERQSIHQKTLDDGSVVRVTEDIDDGAVRVEYESEANVFGDPVQMQYKKPLPDEGDPRPTAQFDVAESGPVGRSRGPDDYEIEVDEVGGSSISDLDSDVSKLKQYATGKGPTMKEIVQNKKRRDKAKAITEDPEAQSDAVIRRQGDADSSYYGDDYARGGIARMLGE